MRTPKGNLKARSAVTSRKSSPATPGWTSAKDVFKSPDSPSPLRRVTRRTSVYQSKVSGKDNFKMPLPKMVSPPGVKTRARRSSIYQKGGGRLLSPKNTRSRRASMYVSSKSKPENVNFFSKVWATPVRQPDPIIEEVPAKAEEKKASRTEGGAKSASKGSPSKSANPKRSVSPKKTTKTPKSVNKSKAAESKTKNISISPQKSFSPKLKTPRSLKRQPQPKASPQEPKKMEPKTPRPKSAKKSSKVGTEKTATPSRKEIAQAKPALVTSTPTKTVGQISGKSFYATPGETPIASERKDEVFVFSAKPIKSAKKSVKKSVHITPVETTPRKVAKTPKRMPTRKTPAVKRNRLDDSADLDVSAIKSPPAKRVKATPRVRTVKSVKRTEVNAKIADIESTKEKLKLSPVEMTSVLKSVTDAEKRKASESPSPRQAKKARVEAADLQTPRVIRTVKRSSPRNLAEVVCYSQNTNNNGENDDKSVNASFLSDTINTDSRSGRCVIL